MKRSYSQRGYTLLFAVLTSAVVLGVAAFVVGIARKQYILSSTARDSASSLYAADSGIECAVQNAVSSMSTSTAASIVCDNATTVSLPFGKSVPATETIPTGFNALDVYQVPAPANPPNYIQFLLRDADNADPAKNVIGCVRLKIWIGYDTNNFQKTIVESRGYNLCNANGSPTASPRTVERAIRLTQ